MTTSVNVQQAKTHLSRLLSLVESGHEVTIARAGRPIAVIKPLGPPARRRLGFVAGTPDLTDAFFEPLPDSELAAWEGL
ncbi:MAG: type II toxin-antitoxin system prevent-host-death family antitoxin [Propionibacteriaceae bacterium]|jgi:prevent-host-death family protein|nr:type II toxin-antitoxin system prevent-host-death family antitoxin [Propionibacteriaceae bacterium]